MPFFWLTVDVRLLKPRRILLEPEMRATLNSDLIHGAFVELGVTAESPTAARKAAMSHLSKDPDLSDARHCYAIEHLGLLDETELRSEVFGDPEIAGNLRGDPRHPGVWYQSGKAWYAEE